MQAFDTFRIGNDPQLRYTPGNNSSAVINLSLATSYGQKDPSTGKRPTQWVDATLWGKHAEALAPYLVKGGEVNVTLDELHIEQYEGRNGPGHKLVGKISRLKLVGGAPQQQNGQQQQRPQQSQVQQPRQQQAAPAPDYDDFRDDIPF